MSVVTNVILVHGLSEEPVPGSAEEEELYLNVEKLNREVERSSVAGWFNNAGRRAGGPKRMECVVYLCAFNGLAIEQTLIPAIESLRWEQPGAVQLFIKRQDEERFSEVPLFGNRHGGRV